MGEKESKKFLGGGVLRTKKVGRNRGKGKARLEEGREAGFAVSSESS